MSYETRVVKVLVCPKGEPIFSENSLFIEIEDEAAGEYVRVFSENEEKGIAIDPAEWETLRDAITDMIGKCRDYGTEVRNNIS